MGVRDALLLNTTGSNFEALQSGDTARIKSDFSVKNTSDTQIFGVDVSAAEVTLGGNLTSSMDISSSLSSTSSFGRVVASTFLGDGVEIRDTLVRSPGLVTASAQIASYISGAFERGFFFGFEASSSISGGLGITGSFGRLQGVEFHGDGHNIKTTLPRSTGILSSSAQIAADISGSFNKGFEFTGIISGSATSTGSFGRVVATTFHGDGQNLQSTLPRSPGIVTSSAQLASDISGSFNKGFVFTTTSSLGHATGSLISAPATAWSTGPNVNSAANNQTAADGTQNAAMVFGGRLGDNPAGICGQKITEEYDGTSWSAGGNMVHNRQTAQGGGSQTAGWAYGGISASLSGPIANCSTGDKTEEYNGSNWSVSEGVIGINGQAYGAGGGTQNAALTHGGNRAPDGGSSNVGSIKLAAYDGTDWTECANSPAQRLKHGAAGTSAAMMFAGNENYPTPGAPTRLLSNEFSDSTDTWTECPNLIYGLKHGSHSGTTNNYLAVGGYEGPGNASPTTVRGCAQKFDGTSWSEAVGMLEPIIREGQGGAGAAIIASGYSYPFATEANSFLYNEYDANLTVDRMKANHITGDGSFIKGFYPDMISGSAQIAADISGSFNKGFEFTGIISGSATSTGSFGQVYSNDFRGDGSELTNVPLNEGVVSSSAQLASNISASFQGGFEFTGIISGSATSTGSFGRIENATYFGDGTSIRDTLGRSDGILSGSAQIAAAISGAILGGTGFHHIIDGTVSGSIFTTGSFGDLRVKYLTGDGTSISASIIAGVTHLTGSSEIASYISGAFTSGFEITGSISGSATSTGSFGLLKPRAGGINTEAFQVTSSLFKLPVFSDVELNYQAYEAQYSTGSLSGSVDRVADVIVGQNLGEMWFDSDKNAIGYTYQSSSLISQSLSLGTFNNTSASGHYFTSSIGLFTQSFYSHTVVTCYLTGSQI